MSDISNSLIKNSYDYVLQSDIVSGNVYRIGGGIPLPVFLSGITVLNTFKYQDGTQQSGYVLTSDSQGNASWQPSTGGGTGTSVNTYVTGFTYNNNVLTIFQNNGVPPLNVTIDSFSGLTINGVVSATTYYGDGSNLTGIPDNYVTGGTLNGSTLVLHRQNGDVSITGFTGFYDRYTTGATLSGNIVYFDRNDLASAYTLDLSGLVVSSNTSNIIYSNTTPNIYLFSGSTWIRTTDYEYFNYDTVRGKWLGVNTNSFGGVRNRLNQTNVFLRHYDSIPYNLSPYIIPKDSTITSVVGYTNSSDTFRLLISTGTTLPGNTIYYLQLTSQTVNIDNNVNVDLNQGDRLYLYMSGTTVSYPKMEVFYKYR